MKRVVYLLFLILVGFSCNKSNINKDFNIKYERIENSSKVKVSWDKQDTKLYELFLTTNNSIKSLGKTEENSMTIEIKPEVNYKIFISIKYNGKIVKSKTKDLQIENKAPFVKKENIINSGNKKVLLNLELDEFDGEIKKIDIDWGDNKKEVLENKLLKILKEHNYKNPGKYEISVDVFDDQNKKTTINRQINVVNNPPIFNIDIKNIGNQEINLYGEIITNGHKISKLYIDWGDGNQEEINKEKLDSIYKTHFYNETGNFNIELVFENPKKEKFTFNKQATIKNKKPNINLNLTKVDYSISLFGKISDEDGELKRAEIYWGDGTKELIYNNFSKINIIHTYKKQGKYTIKVVAIDENNQEEIKNYNLYLENERPKVDMKIDNIEGLDIKISGQIMDKDSELEYAEIDWGDNTKQMIKRKFDNIIENHNYSDKGRYIIKIFTLDNRGGEGSKILIADINNYNPKLDINVIKNGMNANVNGRIYDEDGKINKVEIDWGDENKEKISNKFSEIDLEHNYKYDENYIIKIVAYDDKNAKTTQETLFKPENNTPNLNLDIKAIGNKNEVKITGKAKDYDGKIEKIVINWGDGYTDFIGDGFNKIDITHRYNKSEIYNINIIAYDNYTKKTVLNKKVDVLKYLPIKKIILNEEKIVIRNKNQIIDLNPSVQPKGANEDIIWEISDKDVIERNNDEFIIMSDGVAIIEAVSKDNSKIYASCVVDVILKPDDYVLVKKDRKISNDIYIKKYETTIKEYIEFLNDYSVNANTIYKGVSLLNTNSKFCPVKYKNNRFVFKRTKYSLNKNSPIVEVTWYGAAVYCNWLSQKEGFENVYNEENWDSFDESKISEIKGYRLPTIDEWVYAADGGTKSQKGEYAGVGNLEELAWYQYNSKEHTHDVGLKKANELGIYDMSGNVWEWTNSSYKNLKYIKGGSWYNYSLYCEINYENYNFPSNSGNELGFRVCRSR